MVDYELEADKMREKNVEVLNGFISYMESKGLSYNTQRRHLFNVEFFINEYLLREYIHTPEEGLFSIDEYLSYFYIYKCCWSNIPNLKTTITSFKKFYLYLKEANKISDNDYSELLLMIKDNKDEWIDEIKKAEASMDSQLYRFDNF